MRLSILLDELKENVPNAKEESFLLKMELINNKKQSLESYSCILKNDEMTPKNVANLLYVKYGELLSGGIKIALIDVLSEKNKDIKKALLLLKKVFKKSSFAMTKYYTLPTSNVTKINIKELLAFSSIMKKEEVVFINPFNLDKSKKDGYYITHYKNGYLVNKSSEIINSGIDNPVVERIAKLDKILKYASKDATIYIYSNNKSGVKFSNSINSHLKLKFKNQPIYKKDNFMNKEYINNIANFRYNEYLDILNKELTKKENVVIFTDGGAKNDIGMSSYIIIDGDKVTNKSYLSAGDLSKHCEAIAMLAGLKETISNSNFKNRKIHFVCDSDKLELVYKSLSNKNIQIEKEVKDLTNYNEVKSLLSKHENKIYFHFIKSHKELKDYMSYGNYIVDKVNLLRLRDAEKKLNTEDITAKYEQNYTFDEYGEDKIDFFAGINEDNSIKKAGTFSFLSKHIEENNQKTRNKMKK